MALSRAWLGVDTSMPRDMYRRKGRLVFSLVPRCHGDCDLQKQTLTLVAMVNPAQSVISDPRSQVRDLQSSRGSLRACLINDHQLVTLLSSLP